MSSRDFWQYSWSLFLCDVNMVGLAAVSDSEGAETGAEIFCTVGMEGCWAEGVDTFGTAAAEVWSTAALAESKEGVN